MFTVFQFPRLIIRVSYLSKSYCTVTNILAFLIHYPFAVISSSCSIKEKIDVPYIYVWLHT